MTEHTAGPWQQDTKRNHGVDIVSIPTDRTVANVPYGYDWEANARLIAAAPELLALIEDAVRRWNTDETSTDVMDDFIDAATAAIAKARGQAVTQ